MSPRKTEASGETATCPWCSATVPVAAVTCPSCGASLRDAADGEVLGVTQVDPSAASRAKRIKTGNFASFIGASDGPDGPTVGKVEPPTDEVRQEMLRLELAAIDAEIEAKRKSAEAEAAVEAAELAPEAAKSAPEDEATSG
ncbi:MAG TPA: hypothetical protein VIF63_07315 [Candidatus Limnocylindrales bacterium]|jgi:hypothetical protein